MKLCNNCGHENQDNARFCSQCGSAFELHCPVCDSVVQAGDRFCSNCGHALQGDAKPESAASGRDADPAPVPTPEPGDLEAERREVSVLFADLSDFTHWSSQLDPEETHGILNRYFEVADEIVASYGGRVDKHIGDAIMAVFGAPISHGNDAERAVRAALEIHEVLETFDPPMTAHIGVANGVVVASRTGSDTHREYTVTGNSVNLASRLQGLAEARQTLVPESVKTSLQDRFDWAPFGDTSIKGLDHPVSVWKVLGLGIGKSDSDRDSFVGRVGELEQFSGILKSVRGGQGAAVQLRGEPGIGKSRLAGEFRRRAVDAGFTCHIGYVLDFGTAKGRDASAAVVRSLLGIGEADGEQAGIEAIEKAVGDSAALRDRLPFLCDLAGLPLPAASRSVFDAMDEDDRNAGKDAAFVHLAREMSSRGPLVITIEDIHWGDSGTLSRLAALAAAAREAPILLLMTTRIEGDPIDSMWRSHAHGVPFTTIDLTPLSETEAAEFAASHFNIAKGLIRASIERAAGNPLFLEQLLRSANEVDQDTLPGTVQSIVQSRVDALAPDDRRALQAAAVLGQRFSAEAVRFILESSHYACDSLVAHHLIRPAGDGYMFVHALVRDGVYSSLVAPRRVELHRRAADWFGDDDLTLRAEHLGLAGASEAATAFAAAAKAEIDAYHLDRALGLIDEGLKFADGSDRHALCCMRGDLLRGLGEVEDSLGAFQDALEADQDDTARARALIGLGEGARAASRYDEALKLTEEALAIAGPDQHELIAEIHYLRGNVLFPSGDFESCLAEHELALASARLAGSRAWEARALSGLGDASYLAARMSSSCDYFKQCVALSQELGLGRTEVANRHMIGWTRAYLNEYELALRDGEACLDLATRAGQTRAMTLSLHLLAMIKIDMRQFDEAIELTDKALHYANQLGHYPFQAQSLHQKAEALKGLGKLTEARAVIQDAVAAATATGPTFIGAHSLMLRGSMADGAQRESDFAEAERILEDGCVSHNYFWCFRTRMELALAEANWSEADRFADRMEAYTRSEPLPWSDLIIASTRAMARVGRGERSEGLAAELEGLLRTARSAGCARLAVPLEEAVSKASEI